MRQTYDKERPSLNLARMKSHGENFEVVIDPAKAIDFRHGEADIRDALKAEHVYKDAVKGELASEEHMKEVFETEKPLEIAKRIIKEGSIQISDEYRDKLKREKTEEITSIIAREGANENTGKPLSKEELKKALQEIHIDLFRKPEDQLSEIVEKLKIPITFEKKTLDIRIPASHAAKLYGLVSKNAEIIDEAWLSDGSWSCKAEASARKAAELEDELKSQTHGQAEIKTEKKIEKK